MDKDNYDGLYLNAVIYSIYKKYKINNIVFQDINNNYSTKYKDYILSSYNSILFLDEYKDKFALTFLISYELFKINNGFDNILENDEIFIVFFNNILKNLNNVYKPMFKLINGKINYKMIYNSNIKYDITYKSSYLNIKYKIKTIKNNKNIINLKIKYIEILLQNLLTDLDNNNFVYGIYQ